MPSGPVIRGRTGNPVRTAYASRESAAQEGIGFALGALASAEANAVAEHIASGCSSCQEALKRALDVNVMVSLSAPMVDPPARVRAPPPKAGSWGPRSKSVLSPAWERHPRDLVGELNFLLLVIIVAISRP
jgi:hypothetical protein